MLSAAALYFTQAKVAGNQPRDSVARFHLGNGARLERINWQGDMSEKGVAQGYGLMVNYLYELADIEENHEAFADRGEIIIGSEVRQHLRRRGGAKQPEKQAEKQPEKAVAKPAPEPAAE
jgi:malonyl-CoA decarboxylase